MNDMHEQDRGPRFIYRDPLFDRTLAGLRKQGGFASIASDKAEEFISVLSHTNDGNGRTQFRFTRNGEYRIPNCRKVDLGCGYRIVCIRKGQRLALLYIGTHDDCFRWIARHRAMKYDLDKVAKDDWVAVRTARPAGMTGHDEVELDDLFDEEYEASLMDRLDDAMMRRVFPGLTERR